MQIRLRIENIEIEIKFSEDRTVQATTLDSDIQTVTHVAQHFDALKQRAAEMADAAAASTRGYFTPTEDEEVKHMLVSYWQARNALIELVASRYYLISDPNLVTDLQQRHASFVVAYAGALVLVDAARFLRDQFHENPLIRKKLNEPDPYFGIPAETYETIQKSLTRPLHAWRLYHAARYLNSHWEEIKELTDARMVPILDLVKRLQDRLNISLDRYTLSRVRVRARSLQNTAGKGLFKNALYGLQKIAGSLTANLFVKFDHIPKLRTDVAEELRHHLRPGDVLITRKEFAVTNYFLPGFWPHAALYVGQPGDLQSLGIAEHDNFRSRWQKLLDCDPAEPLRVLEAMKDGVHIRSLNSPFGVDAITVLRPRLENAEIAQALSRGVFHEGKPYDFDFDFNRSDRLVCTEVVYRSYENVGGVQFDLTKRAGRWTLAAEDIIRMALNRNYFEPFAVFSPTHQAKLTFGADAEKILRQTVQV